MEVFSSQFREGKVIIITAIIFAATIGIFGELLGLLFSRLDPMLQSLFLILSLFVAAFLVWFTFILFVSPLSMNERFTCRLIYNFRKGEFLVSIFYSYYPAQGMAMNSVKMMIKIDPPFKTNFQAAVSENSQGKLMKDFIDYLVFKWLNSSALYLSHDSKIEEVDYQTHYSSEIRSNFILNTINDKKMQIKFLHPIRCLLICPEV